MTYDEKRLVYGHPSVVEADVVIKDEVHILVEIKSHAEKSDVTELWRMAQLYEREGVRPKLALVAGSLGREVEEPAVKLGVRVYSYLEQGRGSITGVFWEEVIYIVLYKKASKDP